MPHWLRIVSLVFLTIFAMTGYLGGFLVLMDQLIS